MTRVKTECVVKIYEVNHCDASNIVPRAPDLVVKSHPIERGKVIIHLESGGPTITVVAADLAAAIGKASGGP